MLKNFIFSIAIWICHNLVLAQGNFTAICEAKQVIAGETFRITFQLTNAQGTQFQAPRFENFEIVGGPSRSIQTTIVNGKMSSSQGFVYELLATKPGRYTIGPASILIQGKKYQTQPVQIEVLKGSTEKSTPMDDVFILAMLDKTTAYVGEQLVLQYKIYTQVDISGIEPTTQAKLDGFQVEYINVKDQISKEVHKGKSYTTKILNTIILFPITAKDVIIPPVLYKVALNDNDPFSSFSMGSVFSNNIKTISSNEISLQIIDLPVPAPEEFSGAVGKFTLSTHALQPRYTLNDAIALSYTITGNGNFNTIEPKLQIDSFFEISNYNGAEAIKTQESPQVIKSRVFDYLLVPKQVGDFSFAPAFVYFDTEEKQYRQLIDTLKIQIIEASASQTANVPDILPIKENVKLYFRTGSLWKMTWVLFLLFCPVVILFIQRFKKPIKQLFNKRSTLGYPEKRMDTYTLDSIENVLVKTYQKHWPHDNVKSLRDIKQKLLAEHSSPTSQTLLQFIQEYELLRYSGVQDEVKIKELLKKIEGRESLTTALS